MFAHVSNTSAHIKRILLVRTDRLGDVVLTLPMLPILRTCYPEAYIAMLLNRYTGEIVEGNRYANELLWYDGDGGLVPFWTMVHVIREKRFDTVVVVHPTFRLAWLMFLAGIPVRIGTGYRYYSFLFNRKLYEHRKDAKRHEVEYNLNLLKELGCAVNQQPEFSIAVSSEDRRGIEDLLRSNKIMRGEKFVILHPGSGGSAREWPTEHFAALAATLVAERSIKVIVTGVRGDEAKVDAIVAATGGAAVSLLGALGLKRLAALIEASSLFVSNSTGPLHIAAAVGTPVVALYPQITAMSAARWGPYTRKKRVLVPNKPIDCRECSPETGETCACMASITVDEVFGAALALLDESRVPEKREARI